ncbi:MAG: amidophosphoribosyltransferase [Gammaproteobacteria bacterium]|nr:amidophosphoribosyltransferase [Gammaproteobacteria bacterium]
MCGIIGILSVNGDNVNQGIYDGLTVLQHRGQDAAGIVTLHKDRFYQRKDNGMVKDVFRTRHMRDLHGSMGIGHVRYPTAGSASSAEAQPFYVNSPYGIVLAHNGNLTNTDVLSRELYKEDLRHLNTNSDSEILLNVFAHEMMVQGKEQVTEDQVFEAIAKVHERCRGGYAAVGMIAGFGMFAFRDPYGLRPVVFGERTLASGKKDYIIASETVAVDVLEFKVIRDLAPGEAIVIMEDGRFFAKQCSSKAVLAPCIFEHVYLARPDSVIDGISVYEARLNMGEKLAAKILRVNPHHDIDVVIPIPDTSRTAALQMAQRLGVPYREGFIKNRYIGRTFIMPGQTQRKKSVRQKLNAIAREFEGKHVLLVDDSIVRGTTSAQIVQMARDSGARKVSFASASPAVRYPYVYGIDMPAASELVANNRTVEEVCAVIGADWLVYQDLEDLEVAVREAGQGPQVFDTSCFSGIYVTGDVSAEYLAGLAQQREDSAKSKEIEPSAVGLHNVD